MLSVYPNVISITRQPQNGYTKQVRGLSVVPTNVFQTTNTSTLVSSHFSHSYLQLPTNLRLFFSPSLLLFPLFSCTRTLGGHKLLVPDVRWGYWFLQGAWQCRIHATMYVPSFCTGGKFYFSKIIPESS